MSEKENNFDELKHYEKLPKEEQRALRKEYYDVINPRAKIWRWISILFLLLIFATASLLFYYMIRFILLGKDTILFWLTSSIFVPVAVITATITMRGFEGFFKWLWREKNILSREWLRKEAFTEAARFYGDLLLSSIFP